MNKSDINVNASDGANNMDKEIEKIRRISYKIQVDRVLYIFKRLIDKLNILAHLPFMLDHNGEYLKNFLPVKDVKFILRICCNYLLSGGKSITDTEYSNVLMMVNVESIEFEPHVAQMVDIITYNKTLVESIQSPSDEERRFDVNLMKMKEEVEKLYTILHEKLSLDEKEQADYENKLRQAYMANVKMKESIAELQDQMRRQDEELGGQLQQKQTLLAKYAEHMGRIQSNFVAKINENLFVSEKMMMLYTNESMDRQHSLSMRSRKITEEYDHLLQDDLRDEKTLRMKRYKVETQLTSWLTKYDADIGEKQSQIEALQKEYDGIKEEMDELQVKFDEQEKEYVVMFAEKEAEEEEYLNRLAFEFLTNRAAKTIQKCWREYWARKMARRKARKKKGKEKKKK